MGDTRPGTKVVLKLPEGIGLGNVALSTPLVESVANLGNIMVQ